ncbi:hypothetical protein PTI98_012766 [Pleurotus ostreatus]|nr:hypothetical protein PTI98_012766 [Pleurotus ostreatus]
MASPPPPWTTLNEPSTSSSPVPSNDDDLEHILPNPTRVKRKARNTAATPSSSSAKPAKLPRLHLDATEAVNRSLGTTSMPQTQRRATHHFDSRDLPSAKPSLVEHVLMRKSNTSAATRIVRRKNRDKKPCLSPTPSSPPAAKRSITIHAAGPSRHHASGSTGLPSAPPLRKQASKPEVIVISDDDEPPSVSAPPKFAASKGKARASWVSSKGKTKSGPIDMIELTDSSSSLPSPSALLKAKPLQTYPIFKFAGKTKPQNRKARENCPTRVIKEEGREVHEILDTSEEESSAIPSSLSHVQPRAARTLPLPATHAAVPPSDSPRNSSSVAVDSYIDALLTSIVAAQSVPITSHNSPPATCDTTKNATMDSLLPPRTFTPIEDHRTMPQPLPRRSLIRRSLAASPVDEATSDNAPDEPEDGVLPVFSSSSRIEDNLHKLTTSPPVERPISTNGPLVTSDRGFTPPSDRSNSSSGLDGLRELVRRSRLEAKSRIQSHSPEAPSVARSSASEVENVLGVPSPDAELSTSDILDTQEPSRDVVSGSEPPSPPASSDADSMPATSPVRVPEPEDEIALESVPDITNAVEDESEFELEYWDGPGKAEFPSAPCVASGSEVTTLEVGLEKKPESIETSGTVGADIAPTTAAKDKPPFRPSTGVQDVLALFEEYYEPASSVPEAASKTPDKDIVDELQALEMIHVHSPSRSPSPFVPSTDHRLVLTSSKTLGGNPVFTWQDVVSDLANFKQPCKLAKNIPHSLQDYINRMDAWHRSLPGMRTVLEAAIGENTAEDEPNAPPISIVNNFDDEPCPPWEFYYTNLMWHDEGVPPPDMTGLKGCGCYPRCDPKNGSCSCLQKQRSWSGEFTPDFAYDSRGRLKYQNVPIFECNDMCGCDDDCRNRVVQHGRKCAVQIGKTKNKGWGVFAGPKKIYDGTFLGIYSGELLTEEVAEERGKKYNKFGRTYLFNLDFYFLREGKEEEWEPKYVVDAYHAGNFTRFLNHSCSPNARLNAVYINESNIDKPLLAIFACKDIEPGAEICFSYSGNYDEEDLEEQAERVVKGDAIYERCMCGAKNCTGIMFD